MSTAEHGREIIRWLVNAFLVGAGIVLVLSAAVLLLAQLAQAAPAKPAPTASDPHEMHASPP